MSEEPKPAASTPRDGDGDRPSLKDFLLDGPDLSAVELGRSDDVARLVDLVDLGDEAVR